MAGTEGEERLEALERIAVTHAEAIRSNADLVLALSAMLTVFLALADDGAREMVRQASLTVLGEDPAHAGAAALAEKLTREPRAAFLAQAGAQGMIMNGPAGPQ